MTNEIKEILDNVKKCCEVMKDENFVVYQKQDIIKLLDYITNLQERIELAYKSAQLIKDIGFDYDGYNDVENLKKIINELVDFADDIQRFLRGDE